MQRLGVYTVISNNYGQIGCLLDEMLR